MWMRRTSGRLGGELVGRDSEGFDEGGTCVCPAHCRFLDAEKEGGWWIYVRFVSGYGHVWIPVLRLLSNVCVGVGNLCEYGSCLDTHGCGYAYIYIRADAVIWDYHHAGRHLCPFLSFLKGIKRDWVCGMVWYGTLAFGWVCWIALYPPFFFFIFTFAGCLYSSLFWGGNGMEWDGLRG